MDDQRIRISKDMEIENFEHPLFVKSTTFTVRIAEPYGGHGEAAHLTRTKAMKLRDEIDRWLKGAKR